MRMIVSEVTDLKLKSDLTDKVECEENKKERAPKKGVRILDEENSPPAPARDPTKQIISRKHRPVSASVVTSTPSVRPSSSRAQRPRSASSNTCNRSRPLSRSGTPNPDLQKQQLLASFGRSLRLLGLQLEEEEEGKARKRKYSYARLHRPPKVDGPTFSTRLQSRSVSLENLRHQDLLSAREMVTSAVYEEWYFRKLAEEKERRAKEAFVKERQLAEIEQKKREVQHKAEQNFLEWKQRKIKEIQKEKNRRREKDLEKTKLKADAEKVQKALVDWNSQKSKMLKQQEEKKRLKEAETAQKKAKEEAEKRQHAQEAYAAWIKKVSEMTAKNGKKEKEAKVAETLKERQKQIRREEAQKSYLFWKETKDQQIRTTALKDRLISDQKKTEQEQRVAERLYEAEQAYLEWLDSLDQREVTGNVVTPAPSTPLPWRIFKSSGNLKLINS